jgi:hypothetical protein
VHVILTIVKDLWDLLKMRYIADMVHRKMAGLPWAQEDTAMYRNDQYSDLLEIAWGKWDPCRPANYVLGDGEGFSTWAEYVEYIKGILPVVGGEIIEPR